MWRHSVLIFFSYHTVQFHIFIYKFKVLLQGLFFSSSVILKTLLTLAVFLSFALSNSLKDSSVSCIMGFCSLTPYSSMFMLLEYKFSASEEPARCDSLGLEWNLKASTSKWILRENLLFRSQCALAPSTFMEHQSSVTTYWYTSTGIVLMTSLDV